MGDENSLKILQQLKDKNKNFEKEYVLRAYDEAIKSLENAKFEKVIFIKAICLLNDVFLKFNKVINKLMGGVSNDSKTLCRWSSVLC